MHAQLVKRADELVDCLEGSPEEAELAAQKTRLRKTKGPRPLKADIMVALMSTAGAGERLTLEQRVARLRKASIADHAPRSWRAY